MTRRALVIGHADADGHLIAEQVRRNLDLTGAFDVSTIVDPSLTRDHRAWTRLNEIQQIENADFVFFVDLMFAPSSFVEEATALVDFVRTRPEKMFFLIDHHPLPLRRLASAKNLRAVYRPDVFDVAIGPRSGMMVVAALCENQGPRVAGVKRTEHATLATAMRRAAAIGGPLPGEKLLALLRSNSWNELAELGTEEKEYHRLPRGRRSQHQPASQALKNLGEMASKLLEQSTHKKKRAAHTRRHTMAYDFEIADERFAYTEGQPVRPQEPKASPKDLEAIVTLLELAAISLTTAPDEEFSYEELVREVRSIGGEEIGVEDRDIEIVMEKANFVKRSGKKLRLR